MKVKLMTIAALLTLMGCSPHGDLEEWVQNTQKEALAKRLPKTAQEPVILESYNPPAFTGLHAFDSQRLKDVKNSDSQDENAPDRNRPKEVLENFDIDATEYVGSLTKNGSAVAYIRADGYTYTIKVGNYIGTNFGRLIKIEPDQLVLEETVEDADGKWSKREATIPLSGSDSAP